MARRAVYTMCDGGRREGSVLPLAERTLAVYNSQGFGLRKALGSQIEAFMQRWNDASHRRCVEGEWHG